MASITRLPDQNAHQYDSELLFHFARDFLSHIHLLLDHLLHLQLAANSCCIYTSQQPPSMRSMAAASKRKLLSCEPSGSCQRSVFACDGLVIVRKPCN